MILLVCFLYTKGAISLDMELSKQILKDVLLGFPGFLLKAVGFHIANKVFDAIEFGFG